MNEEERLGRRTPPLPAGDEPQILDAVDEAAEASNGQESPPIDPARGSPASGDPIERPHDADDR